MKLSIRVDTVDFRGDHSTDVCRIIDPRDGETLEQLAARVFKKRDQYHDPHLDVIRIQIIDEMAGNPNCAQAINRARLDELKAKP